MTIIRKPLLKKKINQITKKVTKMSEIEILDVINNMITEYQDMEYDNHIYQMSFALINKEWQIS
jgi:hypothetical protein